MQNNLKVGDLIIVSNLPHLLNNLLNIKNGDIGRIAAIHEFEAYPYRVEMIDRLQNGLGPVYFSKEEISKIKDEDLETVKLLYET